MLKYIDKESDSFNIEEIIRPSVIIPETKKLNVLLSEFKSGRNHLAVVVDEYGGVSGLITIEDVLEQIVGDIIDEHDNVKQNTNIKKIKNHIYTVAGLTTLDEFNAFLKVITVVKITILLAVYWSIALKGSQEHMTQYHLIILNFK